jgi:hypothetical protein
MKTTIVLVSILVGITTLINLTDVSDLDDYERGAFYKTEREVIQDDIQVS